ncbi:TetR/AcrR family transcriptional regulator [bacterium]|nr:TetR/AcrR family transcriptional regulator [bacterium]
MGAKDHGTLDTRGKILEAALNLFSKNGFHATTTRKIAQHAEVNEVTLFRLFKSKLDLFKEILRHVRRVGFDANRLKEIDKPPLEALRFFILTLLETLESYPREYRILHHAVLDEVEGFEDDFVAASQAAAIVFCETAFSELQKKGKIDSQKDPEIMSKMLLVMLTGLINNRILMKNSFFKNMDRESLTTYVLDIFLK